MTPLPLPAPAVALTRAQKAAVIFRLLDEMGMGLAPGSLSAEEEQRLRTQMAAITGLDDATVTSVVDEFIALLEGGGLPPVPEPLPMPEPGDLPELPIMPAMGFAGDDDGGEDGAPDPWERVIAQDDDKLLALLQDQAPEVGAVVMSKLKVSRAAELLSLLPGALARRITYAVSLITEISPDTVHRIGEALASEFSNEPARAFSEGPVEKVGAILNFSRAATRNDVLVGLEETDPEFADAVRKSIFTFANIPARVVPRDIPKILRQVEQPVLVTALAFARGSAETDAAAEFILGSMSQRMAEAIRGEIEETEEIKPADGEAAMTAVVGAIRAMEESGEIYLLADEDG